MSKFFDATQRAAGVEIDPDLEVIRRSKRPNLFQEPIQTVEMEDEELPLSAEALQDDLIDIVSKHKLRLRTFDEETVRLDDIYSQSLKICEEG